MGGAGSRGWTAFAVLGLAGWIGVVIAVGVTHGSSNDGTAVTTAFVSGGAVFFSLMFGGAIVHMRRLQRRSRHQLYERLAVTPMEPGSLRRATRPMYRIGYVYVAFGAVVTALGLAAVAVGSDAEHWLLIVMVALVVVWLGYAACALSRAVAATASVVAPLGLELTGLPQHHVSLLGDMRWTTGATTYAGTRHGRAVSITHTPKDAATVVAGRVGGADVPRDAAAMAALTGEHALQWRGVTVRREPDAVIVTRHRSGAGGWFLHDLLLAEAVAGA